MTKVCPACGRSFPCADRRRRVCSDVCRRDRNAALKRTLRDRAAPPDTGAGSGQVVNAGADYTPAECEFLKRVDRLRQATKFPTATDYFRLAVAVMAETRPGDTCPPVPEVK